MIVFQLHLRSALLCRFIQNLYSRRLRQAWLLWIGLGSFVGLAFQRGFSSISSKLRTGLEWFCRIIDHSNARLALHIPRVQCNSYGLLQGFSRTGKTFRLGGYKKNHVRTCWPNPYFCQFVQMYNDDPFDDENKFKLETFRFKCLTSKNIIIKAGYQVNSFFLLNNFSTEPN